MYLDEFKWFSTNYAKLEESFKIGNPAKKNFGNLTDSDLTIVPCIYTLLKYLGGFYTSEFLL